MAVEREDLELVWPLEVLAAEARALAADHSVQPEALGWLMAEAFHGDRGLRYFEEQTHLDPILGMGASFRRIAESEGHRLASPTAEPRGPQLLADLASHTEQFRRHRPARYYSQRKQPVEQIPLDLDGLVRAVLAVLEDLRWHGYFADAFGSDCVDSPDDPDAEGQLYLCDLLGRHPNDVVLWPPTAVLRTHERHQPGASVWSQDELLDVLEVLHDQVARPRWRTLHDHNRHYDFEDFARRPGRALYRWRINEVLGRSDLGLRLADDGEDAGRLVHAAGEHEVLLTQVLHTPEPADRDAVTHAVALFRGRTADREAKRSAVVALARVLEHRRSLIKRELLSKDADALFHIANAFDLRHRGAKQAGDYDEAFLDWVFWWYLSTIELTDQLRLAQAPQLGITQSAPAADSATAPPAGLSGDTAPGDG